MANNKKIIDCNAINEICKEIENTSISYPQRIANIKARLVAATLDKEMLPFLDGLETKIATGNYTEADKLANDIWLIYRRGGIGGSDASSILGLSKWNTPLALFYDKIGQKPKEELTPQKEYIFEFGHAMEEFVAKHYEKVFMREFREEVEKEFSEHFGKTMEIVKCRVFRDTYMYKSTRHPFMRADLDFCIEFTFSDGEKMVGIFECKTTSPFQIRESWEEAPPKYYECQTRHYMAVMEYPFTIIACAADNNVNNYYSHIIWRDIQKEDELIQKEEDFWLNVENQIPPYEFGQNNKDIILAKTDEVQKGKVVEITTNTFKENIQKYNDVVAEIKSLESKIKELEKTKEVFESDLLTEVVGFQNATSATTSISDLKFEVDVQEVQKSTTSWKKFFKSLQETYPDKETELQIMKQLNTTTTNNKKVVVKQVFDQ